MTAVLLALLTALSYGLANYAGALVSRVHPLGGVLLVGQTVGVVGAGALLLVRGGALPGGEPLVLGALAGVCNAASLACLYAARGRARSASSRRSGRRGRSCRWRWRC